MYSRIAPRDIFNEANFLKCIAQLVKKIESGSAPNLFYTARFSPEHLPFDLCDCSGDLLLTEPLFVDPATEMPLSIARSINSRLPWPMLYRKEDHSEMFIFDDNGELSDEFSIYLRECDESQSLSGLLKSDITHSLTEQSNLIFQTANALKCLAKLAMDSIPGTGMALSNMSFDENGYTGENFSFKIQSGYLVPMQTHFQLFNEPLRLAMPLDADGGWPMVMLTPDGNAVGIYQQDGSYSPQFLTQINHPQESDHDVCVSLKPT